MQHKEAVIVIILDTNPKESVRKENSMYISKTIFSFKYNRKVKNKISILSEVTENWIKALLYLLLYAIKLQ
jgi:hypothetical protein